ncbi:MAG: hypothetical protein ABIE25_07485 [Thermoplasmatota archaeon]|nr:hypothetical protein [Candidatus Thermoplasmatota archaeon]MBU1914106.1 hypothetical protein [Candidatus Thermoplasmatota archaeon]
MERKIIAIMATLVVVAVLVVAFVMVAAGGGINRSGGFTALFDKLEYNGNETYEQDLQAPESWHVNDKKVVSDTIVDMTYRKQTIGQTNVYTTTLWFVYLGTKWSNPYQGHGDTFNVPDKSQDGWLQVNHGMFSIEVSSATNLSVHYSIGDVITLENALERNRNNQIGFGDWSVKNVI